MFDVELASFFLKILGTWVSWTFSFRYGFWQLSFFFFGNTLYWVIHICDISHPYAFDCPYYSSTIEIPPDRNLHQHNPQDWSRSSCPQIFLLYIFLFLIWGLGLHAIEHSRMDLSIWKQYFSILSLSIYLGNFLSKYRNVQRCLSISRISSFYRHTGVDFGMTWIFWYTTIVYVIYYE